LKLEPEPVNVIAFSAGYGDGGYSTYWGLDERGNPACLLTDFAIFTKSIEGTVVVDAPALGEAIESAELARKDLKVWLAEDEEDGIGVAVEGPAAGMVHGRLLDSTGRAVADTRHGSSAGYTIDGKDVRVHFFEPQVKISRDFRLEITFVKRVESK
jgi:hypothetical protein